MKNIGLVVIGTELTRGIIEDKHTSVVAKAVTELGLHFKESVLVPDDGTIKEALSALIPSNDCVIITGGLGPTLDDKTRLSIAECAGKKLVRDEEAWNHLLSTLGERAYGSNEKQSYIPQGFTIIPNPNGTAPGFYGSIGETLVISLPGPPREMRPMFYSFVIPLLSKHFSLEREEKDEKDEYSVFALSEARLDELVQSVDSTLLWGTRFQDYKISLYVSGKDKERRDRAIGKLSSLLGPMRIEKGDVSALEELVDTLKKNGATISGAESCTGGLSQALLTSISGASSYMLGGVVSYSPLVKENVLGVEKSIVEKYGVVSPECAREMAEGVRELTSSDYSFSITGVAGPEKSEGKDVGTVSFGFSGKGRETEAITLFLPHMSRDGIRRRSSLCAFLLMRAYIEGKDLPDIVEKWTVF